MFDILSELEAKLQLLMRQRIYLLKIVKGPKKLLKKKLKLITFVLGILELLFTFD